MILQNFGLSQWLFLYCHDSCSFDRVCDTARTFLFDYFFLTGVPKALEFSSPQRLLGYTLGLGVFIEQIMGKSLHCEDFDTE